MVSTTGDPCHHLEQIWGLKGDHCKADPCALVCMQLLIEKVAAASRLKSLKMTARQFYTVIFEKIMAGAPGMHSYILLACCHRLSH